MARKSTPSYRHLKPRNPGMVTLTDRDTGKRKHVYLGEYDA